MSSPRTILALVALLALAGRARARAQPLIGSVDSVERMVDDATLVVRGEITALVSPDESRPWPQRPWSFVTMRVDETLKGKPAREVRFTVRGTQIPDDGVLARWRARHVPILAFLRPSRALASQSLGGLDGYEFVRFDLAPRTGGWRDSLLPLDPTASEDTPVLTADLNVLKTPAEILTRTRAAIRMTPRGGPSPFHLVRLPDDLVLSAGRRGYGIGSVAVPVDARLERLARGWIRTGDRDRLSEGLRALGRFRSPENEAILLHALDDLNVRRAREGSPRIKVSRPDARATAQSVLDGWGVGEEDPTPPSELPIAPTTPPAGAEPSPHPTGTDTLERIVSDADLVVRGRIVGIERRRMANEPYDEAHWSFVTLKVEETLKGPRRTEVRFAVRIWNDPEAGALERWQATGAPLLVSLRSTRRFEDPYGGMTYEFARYEFAPRSGTVEDSIVPLLDGVPSVVTMTPALLDRARTILDSARSAARTSDLTDPGGPEEGGPSAGTFRAEILPEWKDRLRSQFDHPITTMPVGPHLERRARVWLVAQDPRLNWWGVRALGLFRSEENARLLRRLRTNLPPDLLPSKNPLWGGGPNGETPPGDELLSITRAEIDRILRAWDLPNETTTNPKTRVRG